MKWSKCTYKEHEISCINGCYRCVARYSNTFPHHIIGMHYCYFITPFSHNYHFVGKLRFIRFMDGEHDQYHVIDLSTNQATDHQATALWAEPATVSCAIQVKLSEIKRSNDSVCIESSNSNLFSTVLKQQETKRY